MKRRRVIRLRNPVVTALRAVLAVMTVCLQMNVPVLRHPPHVVRDLKPNAFFHDTLQPVAELLPAVLLSLFTITAMVIVYGFSIFKDERPYLKTIGKLAV